MQIDIKNIFESITPENIKNNPVIAKAMAIFIDVLNEKCSESIDIRNAFQKKEIREELIKIYINDLYNALYILQNNEEIQNTILYSNDNFYTKYKTDFITDIAKNITDEQFYTFNLYKENKGTKKGIKYFFNLVQELISKDKKKPVFELTSNGVFDFTVQGSMPTVLYKNIVEPLSHPLGFIYNYLYVIQTILTEYFGTFIYSTTELGVECLKSDGTFCKPDFLHIDNNLNNNDLNNLRVIKEIFNNEFDNKLYYYFEPDGSTYLVQDNTLRNVLYIDTNDHNNDIDFGAVCYEGEQNPIYHCSIYSNTISELKSYADDSTNTLCANINNFNEYFSRGYLKPYIYINEGTVFAFIGKFYIGDSTMGPFVIIGSYPSNVNARINHFHIGTSTYIQSDYQYILENVPTTTTDVTRLTSLGVYPTITNVDFETQNFGNEIYTAKDYNTFEVYRGSTQLLDYNQSSYPDGYIP